MAIRVRKHNVIAKTNQAFMIGKTNTQVIENVGIFKKSLNTAVNEYLQNSTIAGCKYLSKRTHICERLIWSIVILSAVGGSIHMTMHIWNDFTSEPTIVSLETAQFPIREAPFPAIGICNVNKLSKKRVLEYAKNLSVKLHKPVDYLMNEQLYYLGRLIDHNIEGSEDFVRFMDSLTQIDSNNSTGLFDTYDRMKMLSPSCDEMLVRCRWMDVIVNCSEIFKMRRTAEGFCCTFNYHESIDQLDEHAVHGRDFLKLKKTGMNSGLSIVANPHVDDYYYTTKSSEGFNVLIFNPHDFPDLSSGSLLERIASVNQERIMDIRPKSIYSVPDVKMFPIKQRKCMFTDDNKKKFKGYYSYSNCIVKCRMRSMLALCKCIPFYMPNSSEAIEYCDLSHVPCLHKYRRKFRTFLTSDFFESEIEGLEEEHEDSLACPECYPDCSITTYKVHVWSTALKKAYKRQRLFTGLYLENHTVIHLYYGASDLELFKLDVMYYWFEIVSIFGGVCGLFLGISIMSIIEFVYYFTLRLFTILRRNGYKIFRRF